MSDVTVAQFAEVLKVPVDRLLVQLESAGIPDSSVSSLAMACVSSTSRARLRSSSTISSSNSSMPSSSLVGT